MQRVCIRCDESIAQIKKSSTTEEKTISSNVPTSTVCGFCITIEQEALTRKTSFENVLLECVTDSFFAILLIANTNHHDLLEEKAKEMSIALSSKRIIEENERCLKALSQENDSLKSGSEMLFNELSRQRAAIMSS